MKIGKLTSVLMAALCVTATPFNSDARTPEPKIKAVKQHTTVTQQKDPHHNAEERGVERDPSTGRDKAIGRDEPSVGDGHNHNHMPPTQSDQGPEGPNSGPNSESSDQANIQGPAGVTANGICVTSDELFAVTGSARISLLKTGTDFDCMEDSLWGSSKSNMELLFKEADMISIAQEARLLALSYDGSNANALRNFLLYLRVGVWAQSGNSDVIGAHSAAVDAGITDFLDAFAINANYYNTDEVHGYTVKEAMILMGTKLDFHTRYLPQVISWFNRYDQNWGANMQRLLTQSLTLLYRARNNAAFISHVETDMTIIDTLDAFLRDRSGLLGTNREYQFNDTASELSRMIGYGGQAKERAKLLVRNFLSRYTMFDDGSGAWINMADQIDFHDRDNCAYYGTCNYKQILEDTILPITHNCSSSLRVRAQAVTNEQLVQICSDLAAQEAYFHERLQTGNVPVADDNNATLELVIYDSSTEYKKYSGSIFGNSTNNGGQYLEGDPSQAGNIPRFFAHEAQWLLPEFVVWNLKHEYVHYLDGRFNLYGDFRAANAFNTVMWGEGIADYMAKKQDNDDAIVEARKNTYALSELFKTTYENSDATRTYSWGYLAMRYLFEERRSDIDTMLSFLRVGQFQEFQDFQDITIGTRYDADFAQWLTSVESIKDGDSSLANGSSTALSSDGQESPTFTINVPDNAKNLSIRITGGTGDADLHVKAALGVSLTNYDHRPWKNGNEETVLVANPTAGSWSVMAAPYRSRVFDNVTLMVSWEVDNGTGGVVDACATSAPVTRGNMESGDAWCLGEHYAHIGIYVDAGTSQLILSTSGGQGGDATLYQSDNGWTSGSLYDNRSSNANSNNESIIVNNPQVGWHYIGVDNQGSGVTLSAALK
ncbi:collagenase [Arenicella sp. 4NH20-0111]|uniref:M9 family metallopeptidase n=1 Tax=Arenicella sp. 4NH20-0111 TaxID=3127648 RepID=UPI00333E23D9